MPNPRYDRSYSPQPDAGADDEELAGIAAEPNKPTDGAPSTGTTGGITVESQQGGEWWNKPSAPVQWSADPIQRRKQVVTETQRSAKAQYDQNNPFLPSMWQPTIPAAAYRDTAARAEDEFRSQVLASRQQAAKQKLTAQAAQKSQNASLEAQYRGSGQQFYTDPYGKITPVLEQGTNRPLFHPTEWAEGVNQQGQPSLTMRDRYGQPQYKSPAVIVDPDPLSGRLMYDLPSGAKPIGNAQDFVNHENPKIAKAARLALARQRMAQVREAMAPAEELHGQIQQQYDQSRLQLGQLQDQRDAIDSQMGAIPDDVINQHTGELGTWNQPTPAAQRAIAQKNALQSQRDALDNQIMQMEPQVAKGGSLWRKAEMSKIALGKARLQAQHDAQGQVASDRMEYLRSQGASDDQIAQDSIYQNAVAMQQRHAKTIGNADAALGNHRAALAAQGAQDGAVDGAHDVAHDGAKEGAHDEATEQPAGVIPPQILNDMDALRKEIGIPGSRLTSEQIAAREYRRKMIGFNPHQDLNQPLIGFGEGEGTVGTIPKFPDFGDGVTGALDSGITRGLANSALKAGSGLTTLPNLALLAATGGSGRIVQRLISGGFGAKMLHDVYKETPAAWKLLHDPNASTQQKTEAIGDIAINLVLGAGALKHATTGGVKAAPVGPSEPSGPAAAAEARRVARAANPSDQAANVVADTVAAPKPDAKAAIENAVGLNRPVETPDAEGSAARIDQGLNAQGQQAPANPASESAKAFTAGGETPAQSEARAAQKTQAFAQQTEAVKEQRIQQLVDQASGGDDLMRRRVLAARKNLSSDDFKDALEAMIDVNRHPDRQRSTLAERVGQEAADKANSPITQETPGIATNQGTVPAEIKAMAEARGDVQAQSASAGHAGISPDELATRQAGAEMAGREAPQKPTPASTYAGFQEGAKPGEGFHLYTLKEGIPDHPEGSTVSADTLKQEGYDVSKLPAPEAGKGASAELETLRQQENPNAIPEQSTGTTAIRQTPENGERVGEPNPVNEGAPGARPGTRPEPQSQSTEAAPEGTVQAEVKPRTSDKIIDALKKAKISKPGQVFAHTPFTLAYDAGIDTAIAAVRAGRAIGDAVKAGIERFKAKFPDHTTEDLQDLEKSIRDAHGGAPASPAAGIGKMFSRIRDESDLKNTISANRDAVEGQANQYAAETKSEVSDAIARSEPDAAKRSTADEALRFYIESSDGSRDQLRDMRDKIANSEKIAPKWRARSLKAIDYALENGDKLKDAAQRYRRIMSDQLNTEQSAGLPTLESKNYVPRYQDVEDGSWLDGKRGEMGSGQNRKNRSYETAADALAAGIDPKTLSATDSMTARVRNGMATVHLNAWQEALHNIKDPTTQQPVALKPERTTRADGSYYYEAPKGYELDQLGNRPVAIKKEYSGLVSALTDPSWFEKNKALILAQKANALGKSLTLAVDTFHLGRLALRDAMINASHPQGFKVGARYQKGLLLADHSPEEIARMGESGEIPKDKVAGYLEQKKVLDKLVGVGYNIGRVADNMHSELVQSLPVLGGINKFIFQKFQRGAMTDAGILEYQRQRADYPNLSDDQVARKVSRELLTRFGNLGRQGLFKSKTSQDMMRMLFLAPQWNEGLIRSELGGVKDVAKSAFDAARGRGVTMGLLGREMLTTGVSLFVASQLLNQATRGKFTWENPEETWGAKLSAWIPDKLGGSSGFFLNPMGMGAETTHLLLNNYERSGGTAPAMTDYLRSRLSSSARPFATLFSGKNVLGQNLKPSQRWTEAAKDAVPLPISGGAVARVAKGMATGGKTEKFPGEFQKQAMQSIGLRTDAAPSPEQRMYGLAKEFNSAHGKEDSGEHDISDYHDFTEALRRGNPDDVKNSIDGLLQKKSAEELEKYYTQYATRQFTGSKKNEANFFRVLNPEQRQQYAKARQDRQRISRMALDAIRRIPANRRAGPYQPAELP